ncbi:FHA domain-containing protein [Spirosoma soli]|uniref:FHA domain-containing protein n=1 Tax=Spirosoma soli TaxID=1770529 RepID=A0ABW5M934_9BACT
MANQPGGWLGKLSNLLVPSSQADTPQVATVTNKRILDELIASFEDSIGRESVGASMLFNAHFLIILHPDTYESRQNAFPVIVNEVVSAFKAIIESQKGQYSHVSPVASSWFFKFGAGREFGGEVVAPTDVKVIGALTGILPGNIQAQSPDKVNVTRRVKQTNRYEKVDVDLNTFQHIDFREPGAFVVKFNFNPPATASPAPVVKSTATSASALPKSLGAGLAAVTYYMAELNKEDSYLMRDREIVVARKEPDNQHFPNYLLVESAYVSNPHARIRYNDTSNSFEIASFSRNETRVNERLIPRSEPASPQWFPLPGKAQILLNSMVTLNFQSNT